MKFHYTAITLLLLILSSSQTNAQYLDSYFTPYGFQYPNLESGQYVLSLRGDYEDSKYNRKTDHNYEIERRFDVESSATLSGVFAVTDYLILGSSLSYYPKRFTADQLNAGLFFSTARLRELEFSSWRPSFSAVFKPRSNFEIFGNFGYSYYEYDLHGYDDYYDTEFDTYPYWRKSYTGSVGVTWLGQAW